MVEPLGHVLHAHAQLVDRSAQAAGDAIAGEEPAQGADEAQQEHRQAELAANPLALEGHLLDRVLIQPQQLPAGLDDVPDRVGVGQVAKVAPRPPALDLPTLPL